MEALVILWIISVFVAAMAILGFLAFLIMFLFYKIAGGKKTIKECWKKF